MNTTENDIRVIFEKVIFEKMNSMEKQIKLLEKKAQFQDCVISELLKSSNGTVSNN
jgi:hypothetical protein